MTKADFKDGLRVVMLLLRAKNGGHNRPDYHVHRRITRNIEEYDAAVQELSTLRDTKEQPELWRIYSTLNRRNIEKAIRIFKTDQLEADYYDEESRHRFYIDIKNRWVGALMKPQSRAETFFLVDVDTNHGESIEAAEKTLHTVTDIFMGYSTPFGVHFIVKPYNHTLTPELEVKKDALMLVDNADTDLVFPDYDKLLKFKYAQTNNL